MTGFQKNLKSILLFSQFENCKSFDIKNKGNKKTKTILVTNGSLFTDKKLKELEKSELDILVVSIDAFNEETYNKIRQGLNFKSVMNNIEKILYSNYDGCFFVGFVKQKDNIEEFNNFKKYWLKKGVGIHLDAIVNRSGDLINYDKICLKKGEYSFSEKIQFLIYKNFFNLCLSSLTTLNILTNGDVILCCNDYTKKLILGNLNNSTITDIWNSEKYQKIREQLKKREYEKIPTCKNCSINQI